MVNKPKDTLPLIFPKYMTTRNMYGNWVRRYYNTDPYIKAILGLASISNDKGITNNDIEKDKKTK